ncbi:uncharacterized protein LOC125026471 [Penaeus chinensis]|uniref:uncharacterized protein LOC125026471 n=1 Tax=Penaeus chinensis TaxID=139456 RepID=UPI001FB74EC1|nr:uncharacterized protein LOC125026471 [Penaeus chinensis]
MKVLACVLLAAGLVSAQLGPDAAPVGVDAGAAPVDVAAGDPNTLSSPAAAGAGAGAGASAGAAAAQQSFRDKVYGAGLNNPAAFPPNMLAFNRAKHIVTNIRPDLRVRVNIDGSIELTDIYGQEVDEEVIFPDLEEIQEQRLQAQRNAILRRRQEQDAQLIREFNLGANAQDFGLGNFGQGNQGGFTI